jgi:hypothetical protein
MNFSSIKKLAALLMMTFVITIAIFADTAGGDFGPQQDPPKNNPPKIVVPPKNERPPSNPPRNDNKSKKP